MLRGRAKALVARQSSGGPGFANRPADDRSGVARPIGIAGAELADDPIREPSLAFRWRWRGSRAVAALAAPRKTP